MRGLRLAATCISLCSGLPLAWSQQNEDGAPPPRDVTTYQVDQVSIGWDVSSDGSGYETQVKESKAVIEVRFIESTDRGFHFGLHYQRYEESTGAGEEGSGRQETPSPPDCDFWISNDGAASLPSGVPPGTDFVAVLPRSMPPGLTDGHSWTFDRHLGLPSGASVAMRFEITRHDSSEGAMRLDIEGRAAGTPQINGVDTRVDGSTIGRALIGDGPVQSLELRATTTLSAGGVALFERTSTTKWERVE